MASKASNVCVMKTAAVTLYKNSFGYYERKTPLSQVRKRKGKK